MPHPSSLRPGDPRKLGRYRLLGYLGEGGQGTVYLGRGPDGVHVAVKVLHARFAGDARALRRFVREAEAARRVAQFCTARVLEVADSDSRPYVVSEYVPGESLRQLVDRDGPRDAGALERLAVNTATALAAIHQAAIVHLDFKPSNVLMGPDGPRVIDFGIARALDGSATESGHVVGTPAYMSPEQIRGERVGPASDMFSWGATLLYAATGVSAFGNDGVHAVMHRVLTSEPDVSVLPPPLRDLVAAALAKRPDRRPAATDVLPALLGPAGSPVSAAPPTVRPGGDPTAARHERSPAGSAVTAAEPGETRPLARAAEPTVRSSGAGRPGAPDGHVAGPRPWPDAGPPGRWTRRRVVLLAAVATVTGAAVPAGLYYGAGPQKPTTGPDSPDATPHGSAAPGGGVPLAKTSDIPVGGGVVFREQDVVVTQPTAGRFVAFSAICTHQGCTVADVAGGTINCPCHGSRFRVSDASVAAGPATEPLPRKPIKVANGEIDLI